LDEKESKRGNIEACINCGKCMNACPQGLEPVYIAVLSQLNRFEECERNGVLNCCECGSCSYTCPAYRPILDYIRVAKSKVMAAKRK